MSNGPAPKIFRIDQRDLQAPLLSKPKRFDGKPQPARIPQIIHQAWNTEKLPPRWSHAITSVKERHPGWEYRLWTHDGSLAYVRQHHPELYPAFIGFNREIMRCDVMRYVVMHDLGGMYCDLDYEFLRPYDYGDAELVLGYEKEFALGDAKETLANFVFASAPGHLFWKDVLDDVVRNPPVSRTERDVINLTGPGLLTRVFFQNPERYENVVIEPRLVFNPYRMRGKNERMILLNNGVTVGVHHAFGSWKRRWTAAHWRRKLTRLIKRDAA
jgi:mannosyltransferase OCH1-like enzyme